MELATSISHILLWLILFGIGFLLLGSLRAQGLLSWRLAQLEATTPSRIGRSGLKPGKRAPEFSLPSVAGGEVALSDFAGRKVLLVFVQSGCGPCHDIAPELNRFASRNGDVQVLVLNNAAPEEAREFAREVNARFPILVQQNWSVSKQYEVFATPFAFLIDEHGIVAAKGIVNSREHLGYLLSSAASSAAANREARSDPATANEHMNEQENGTERGASSDSLNHIQKELHHV
jgi:methylamine dehydrogenase accessory protein MauD